MNAIVTPLDTGYLALFLRVIVGVSFIIHGTPKLKGGWKQSGQWIKSAGVPASAAVLTTILEFFGGIFLVVGLIVPVVAGFLAIQMLSITVMKKFRMNGSFLGTASGKPSYEIDIVYLLLAITLVVLGAGALSIDSLLGI